MRLFREIGLLSSIFLVIGNIIGIGIFTTSGLIAAETGSSPWLIGVWIIGGILAISGAVCYSLLSVHHPQAGGEFTFLYPTYGPLIAFVAGWASLLIGFSAPIAASALGLAAYLNPLFPSWLSEHPWTQKVVAEIVLLCVSLFLTLGLKFGNRLHSLITAFNIILIIGFAALVSFRLPLMQNLQPIMAGGFSTDLPSLGSAIVMVMFAYSGWNAAAYMAEEIRNPERYVPRAMIIGTSMVIVVYILMNIAYFGSVPISELQGKIAVAEISAVASFGTSGILVVNVLILFSILSSITAMSIAGPRVYFAMSRNRLFPKWLADVDEKRKVPLKSIWFQTTIAFALVAVAKFREILIYSGFVLLLFSTLTVSVLLTKQRKAENQGYFLFFYRFLPGFFVLVNSIVLLNAAASNPKETIAAGITLVLGLPVYFYYSR